MFSKPTLLALSLLFVVSVFGQTVTMDRENVLVDGKKLCSIRVSKKGAPMFRYKVFTIQDAGGIDRLRYENGLLYFVEDKFSFAYPPDMGQDIGKIAAFLAGDTLLTTEGFNAGYKRAFIRKYDGVLEQDRKLTATGIPQRDKEAPLFLCDGKVWQDGQLLGSYKLDIFGGGEKPPADLYVVFNVAKTRIAEIRYFKTDSYTATTVESEIRTLHDGSVFKRKSERFKSQQPKDLLLELISLGFL